MTSKLDPQELERLSKAATGVSETVDGGRWSCTIHFGEGEDARANMRAFADFVLTSRRTGQLVPAMPSGDVVEAVARALYEEDDPWCKAWPWPNLQPDQGSPDAYRRLATAAITTYEAVSGVAKMREALEDLRATPYPPVEDPDDTLGSMLDNQAWIVLSHVASRIGQRDGIEFMERWQDAWAEGEVQKGYFSPHRGVAAWIARHCQLTPEARAALGEKP